MSASATHAIEIAPSVREVMILEGRHERTEFFLPHNFLDQSFSLKAVRRLGVKLRVAAFNFGGEKLFKLSKRAFVGHWVAILLLTACSPPPPIVSADTSCERFAHISATDAQIKVFQGNWDAMETYADQVVSHNVEYDKSCLGPVKP